MGTELEDAVLEVVSNLDRLIDTLTDFNATLERTANKIGEIMSKEDANG